MNNLFKKSLHTSNVFVNLKCLRTTTELSNIGSFDARIVRH
jgi:hypothetical protein